MNVAAPPKPVKRKKLEVLQTATDHKKIKEATGRQIIIEGVVGRADRSRSGIHWYLEFNEGTPQSVSVLFKHGDDKSSGEFRDWVKLENRKVRVRGNATYINRGGKRPGVNLGVLSNLKVLADMRVRKVEVVSSLFSEGFSQEEIIVEGTLKGFGKSEEAGYLVFEETADVQVRFLFESDFGNDVEFRNSLVALKGEKIRVTGRLQEDAKSGIAIQIDKANNIKLAN